MNRYCVKVAGVAQQGAGYNLVLRVPEQTARLIQQQAVADIEIGIDDGRSISVQQRAQDLCNVAGILRSIPGTRMKDMKQIMKVEHVMRCGCDMFSLSDCSMTTAREFINTLMEYALKEGVILTESGLQRTDDIDTYLMQCIRYRKCCICGRPADIHHVDTIGMGNDRHHYDDSQNRIMALCRQHHQICHQRGTERFCDMYKVYGIERYRTEKETMAQ